MLPILLVLGSLLGAQAEPACTRWQDCRQLALDAAERGDFETFHSLAWRAVQTGQPNDPELMFMLARAQALSGRPDDALVMLGRLADRGVLRVEAETLEDFSHVRDMPGWPSLLERLHGMPAAPPPSTPAPPTPAPPTPASTPPPARSKAAAKAVITPPPPAATPAPAVTPLPPIAKREEPPPIVEPTIVPPASLTLVPPMVRAPLAIAYDKVSARMIIADDSSGTLRVLSDATGNIVDLVSAGWGGGYHSNALVIDSKRGDLWVVGTRTGETPNSILHHVQLISGRLLSSVPPPDDAGATRFAAVALSSNSVFVLDAEGGRLFELAAGAKTLRSRIEIPQRDLSGLTLGSDSVAYVTHTTGILRIDLATKKIESVKASPGIPLDGIEWIAYFENSLLAVQRRADGTMAAVRLRFDRNGRTVTAVDSFGAAGAKGAMVLENTFYFVSALPVGTAVARVNLR